MWQKKRFPPHMGYNSQPGHQPNGILLSVIVFYIFKRILSVYYRMVMQMYWLKREGYLLQKVQFLHL